jgi:hypothetical protein
MRGFLLFLDDMLKLDPEEMSETIRTCPESIARLCHLPSDDDHDDRDTLSPLQQAILFVQMIFGSPVSLFVNVRRSRACVDD